MRIGIGLVVLSDLIIRSNSLVAHYTSEGVLPVSLLMEFDYKPLRFSLHNLNDTLLWQSILFILHAIITLFLIFGYRTKLFTILSWVFLLSLQNRNPFIQQSGDDLLRLVLFWGMFLPWGNFYSLDSRKQSVDAEKYFFSVSTLGYMFLIASVYFFSALLKTSPEWRSEGTAIYYALSLDQLKLGMGNWLYQYPTLMKILTHFVFYIEVIAPIFLILPYKNNFFRTFGAILIFILHIGIALNLYVGLFFVIGITSTLGMLPSSVMDWIDSKILKTKRLVSASYFKLFDFENLFRTSLFSLRTAFLSIVIILCLLMNFSNCKWFPYKVNSKMMTISNVLKLDQFWGMFSPGIYKTDGWYVYKGFKEDNSVWDIYNNKAGIDFSKPKSIVKMYESDRWRKLAENYQKVDYNFMKPYYCRYLMKKWNKEHPDNKIVVLNIIFLLEETMPDYKTKPIQEESKCLCYEHELAK